MAQFKNVCEFINEIQKYMSVTEILEQFKDTNDTGSEGKLVERLWDIVIKFGACHLYSNTEYIHLIGNVNNGKLKPLISLKHYLLTEKVNSGNSTGISDITLLNQQTQEHIFFSSKCYLHEKSVKSYDVSDIVAMTNNNKYIYQKYKIVILTKNKSELLTKIANAHESSDYITKHMTQILDIDDLNQCFLQWKLLVKNQTIDQYDELFGNGQTHLKLKFHQKMLIDMSMDLIQTGHNKILWGCKCRCGKCYMCGGLIDTYLQIKSQFNVLIITPAPTETKSQFMELFQTHNNFNQFEIIDISQGSDLDDLDSTKSNQIIVISKQLLGLNLNCQQLKAINFDLCFSDENHCGVTTTLAEKIFETYLGSDTILIFMTATYRKTIAKWQISTECCLYWNLEDEQYCKSLKLNKLYQKFGQSNVQRAITYFENHGITQTQLFQNYQLCPDMHYLTNQFDIPRFEEIKKNIQDTVYGFSFGCLFAIQPSLDGQTYSFKFPDEVAKFLRYISGSREKDFPNGNKSIFKRIVDISNRYNSRTKLTNATFTTQLWYLPCGRIGQSIANISKCLKQSMKTDQILKDFAVLIVNGEENISDVKAEIAKQEIIAKEDGYRGLIILAGQMLKLGITLNQCDVVMLLNDMKSSDDYYQMIHRCMTESSDGSKKLGFVVDLNCYRVVNALINFDILKSIKDPIDKLTAIITDNLINIDVDWFDNYQQSQTRIIAKLIELWNQDPVNSFSYLKTRLTFDLSIDKVDQDQINQLFQSHTTDKLSSKSVKISEDNQKLPSGSNLVSEDIKGEIKKDTSIITIIPISFTKDVLPYAIPLICLLDIRNETLNLVSMIKNIQNQPDLLNIFNHQVKIWWKTENNVDIINFIELILNKYNTNNSNIDLISQNFKMQLKSLIDEPIKLLELINSCLKPKLAEQKKFGEVFTPIDFINNQMLKAIEDYWMNKYHQNIWTNSQVTFYDPTSGMGNYSVAIYYKLMAGLESIIPNYDDRQKHIIETQLYMGELNPKNCFVTKQIFNFNNKYQLNLYEGDTLKINLSDIFKRNQFDIIIGNPPYNEELKSDGGNPLYNQFIEYYINKCQMLSFIVPSRWFAGGKGLIPFRKMMLNRTDLVYINHLDEASDIFDKSVDIKGGVNYFLIDHNYQGLCCYNGIYIQLNKYDILVSSQYYTIINKLLQYPSITNIYLGRYFGIETNCSKLTNDIQTIKCYVSQTKGSVKYIDKTEIKNDYNFFKVITARAAHKHNSGFANTFIGNTNEIHSNSYLSFKISTEKEAQSLLSYFKCKLPNFMLSLRKMSQDISESTCKWIPLPPLDRTWNNFEVYTYYKLSNDDIKLIESTNVIGYTDTIITPSISQSQSKIKIQLKNQSPKITIQPKVNHQSKIPIKLKSTLI